MKLIEPKHLPDVGKMVEPTDNTKIEELDKYSCGMRNEYNSEGEVYARGFDLGAFGEDIIDKLNEVIRYINK